MRKKSHKRIHIFETTRRSFIKSAAWRIVEVIIDTLLLFAVFGKPLESFGVSIVIELVCMGAGFSWERLWNKIEYGRHLHEKGEVCKDCKKTI